MLNDIVEKYKPNIVLHLAVQAGVRHSLENPEAYLYSNLIGTYKVLEATKNNKIDHLLMAFLNCIWSNDKLPFTENQKCDTPLSFYAATKKSNETMAHSYSHLYSIPITMFRFFTVYGPWVDLYGII